MTLQKRAIDVPIVGGVETGTEGPLKIKLETLENGVYRKKGGIQKRFGTRRRGQASDIPDGDLVPVPTGVGRTLAAFGDVSVLIADQKVYSFTDETEVALNNGRRIYKDKTPEAVATYDVVAAHVETYAWPDVAYGAGFYVYTFNTDVTGGGNGVLYTSTRDRDGAAIQDNFRLHATNTVNQGRVVFVPGPTPHFVAFWLDFATETVHARAVLAGSTNWSPVATVPLPVAIPGGAPPAALDAVGGTIDSAFAAVTRGSDGGFYFIKATYDPFLASFTFVVTASTDTFVVGVIGLTRNINNNIAVATGFYFLAPPLEIRLTVFDQNANELTTPIVAASGYPANGLTALGIGPALNGLSYMIVFSDNTLPGPLTYVVQTDGVFSTFVPTSSTYDGLRVISKPWLQNGRSYVALQRFGSRGGVYVAEVTPGLPSEAFRPVVTVLPRNGTEFWMNWPYPDIVGISSAVMEPVGQWRFGAFAAVGTRGVVMAVDVEHETTRRLTSTARMAVEANNTLMITGGVPFTFDGSTAAEVGFLLVPDTPNAVPGGAGSMSGTYQYALIYEWVDAKNNVHRSAPAFSTLSITVPPGSATNVTVEHMDYTAKVDDEALGESAILGKLYRTLDNGTVFFLAHTFINNPLVPTLVINDTLSDASIADNEILYTTGAGQNATAVANVNPPSSQIVHVHKNRFWLGGTDDDSLWYSKTLTEFEAPAFADQLTIGPFDGGRVTGLGSVDDTLVVLKRRGIWVIVGDGANDAGLNSTLTEPRRVSADAGCIEKRSVVTTPDGVMFLSERGFYLLSRSLSLAFIGEDVVDFTSPEDARISSGVLVPHQNQVRYTVLYQDETAGITLIYDYLNRAWSVARYTDTFEDDFGSGVAVRGASAACMVAGRYWWTTSTAGQEYEEDETGHLDDGTEWVGMVVESAWMKLTGNLLGYQRAWRVGILGEHKSFPSDVSIVLGVRTDYEDPLQTATFDLPSAPIERVEIRPVHQRCSSVRVRFHDQEPLTPGIGTGAGITLDGFVLEWGALPGKTRSIAATRKGEL